MQTPRSACKIPTAYVHHDNQTATPVNIFTHLIPFFPQTQPNLEARFVVFILKKPKEGPARLHRCKTRGGGGRGCCISLDVAA